MSDRQETRPDFSDAGATPGIDAQRLCDAASLVFFAIVQWQAHREGRPVQVLLLMCPRSIPKCPCEFARHEVLEAETFLLRLGFIERRCGSDTSRINL